MDTITLNAPLDAHVHLRQGNMMKLVTPHVQLGGIKTAFVMVCYTLSTHPAATDSLPSRKFSQI